MKSGLKKYFSDFFFFYRYLELKMLVSIILSFSVGLLDGLGLAMFVPLLQLVGNKTDSVESTGDTDLNFFSIIFENLGIPFNLVSVLLLILFFFTLKGVARFLESYYTIILTTDFVKKVRMEAIDKIVNIDFRYFIKVDSGKVQNTLSGEIERIQQSYKYFASSIQSFISILVYVSLAFLTNPQFALLVAIGGAFSNLIYTQLYKKTKNTSKNITKGNHLYHGLMMQQVNNYKYLRATGQINFYSQKIKKSIIELANNFRKIGFFNSLLVSTKEPLAISVVVLVILIQTTFFEAELGPIILSLMFFYRSLNQVINYQNSRNSFLNYSGSLYNYKDFIDELNQNQFNYDGGNHLERINTLEVKNGFFSYNDKGFLKNIDFKIDKNTTIAFVGKSGSGKTTITNILCGLLFLESGELQVNGVDIENINLNDFQKRIGYITQEPVIFNDTLFNNITFWADKSENNLKKFNNCLEMASLSEFYDSLELKEETQLGNNGVLLSGGQKQRVAIAREIFKDVDLLVLDEATSALDSATEIAIQESFERLKGKFTMVVIAHRLSTIKSSDVIFILEEGRITGVGDFNSLQEKSFEFKKMVELQGID